MRTAAGAAFPNSPRMRCGICLGNAISCAGLPPCATVLPMLSLVQSSNSPVSIAALDAAWRHRLQCQSHHSSVFSTHLKSKAATGPLGQRRRVSSAARPPPLSCRGHAMTTSHTSCSCSGSSQMVSPGLQQESRCKTRSSGGAVGQPICSMSGHLVYSKESHVRPAALRSGQQCLQDCFMCAKQCHLARTVNKCREGWQGVYRYSVSAAGNPDSN